MSDDSSHNTMLEACRAMMQDSIDLKDAIRVNRLNKIQVWNDSDSIFGDIVSQAAKTCGMPSALLTLIGQDEAFIKASFNSMPIGPEPRQDAVCNITIQNPSECLVIENALNDDRVKDNWKVQQGLMGCYAGAPIVTHDGIALGALCVGASFPKPVSDYELDSLKAFARIISFIMDAKEKMAQ